MRQQATPRANPKRQRIMPQSKVVSMPDFDRRASRTGAASAATRSIQLRMPSHAHTSAKTTYVHISVLIDQLGPFHVRLSCSPRLCTRKRLLITADGELGPVNVPSVCERSRSVSHATKQSSM